MSNGQEGNNGNPQMEQSIATAAAENPSQLDDGMDINQSTVSGSVPFADFGTLSNSKAMVPAALPTALSLNSMLDVPLPIIFEVGRTKITIADLMELREGSFIDLRNMSVDEIDVRVDEQLIAAAEAISLQQRYGIRISEIARLPSGEDVEDAS